MYFKPQRGKIPEKKSYLTWLIPNLWKSRNFKKIPIANYGKLFVMGLKPTQLISLVKLSESLRNRRFAIASYALYLLAGRKLCLVAVLSTSGQIIGFNQYYFEERRTDGIHEAFIGVHPDFRRRGIARLMRSKAIEHFRRNGCDHISTDVDSSNQASRDMASELGFKLIGGPQGNQEPSLQRLKRFLN